MQQTDGQGQATQSRPDSATNPVLVSIDPLGRTTSFDYDVNGNVTKITDPALHETRFTYDAAFNQVKKITDALNQVTDIVEDLESYEIKPPKMSLGRRETSSEGLLADNAGHHELR